MAGLSLCTVSARGDGDCSRSGPAADQAVEKRGEECRKKKPLNREVSTGNVFADIGVADAGEHPIKAGLVVRIARIIRQRKLTQVAAAQLMGIDQPKVSAMLAGQFRGYSVERLCVFWSRWGMMWRLSLSLGGGVLRSFGSLNVPVKPGGDPLRVPLLSFCTGLASGACPPQSQKHRQTKTDRLCQSLAPGFSSFTGKQAMDCGGKREAPSTLSVLSVIAEVLYPQPLPFQASVDADYAAERTISSSRFRGAGRSWDLYCFRANPSL